MCWNELECEWVDWVGMRWGGLGWVGMSWNELNCVGMSWIYLGCVGTGWNGSEWVGLGWNGLEWVWMGWNKLDKVVLGWNGVEWNEVEWVGRMSSFSRNQSFILLVILYRTFLTCRATRSLFLRCQSIRFLKNLTFIFVISSYPSSCGQSAMGQLPF